MTSNRRFAPMTWVNAVLQGIFLGGYYALLAAGLALMFGLMRIINLAHGDIAVLGAYLIMVVLDHWNVSPFVGLLPVLPVMLALGYLLQRTVLDRSLRSGVLVPLLATFGLSIVIQNVLLKKFSPDVRSLGGQAGSTPPRAGRSRTRSRSRGSAWLWSAVAAAILGGLQLYLSKTNSGRRMRATAQGPGHRQERRHRLAQRLRLGGRRSQSRSRPSPASSSRSARPSTPTPARRSSSSPSGRW